MKLFEAVHKKFRLASVTKARNLIKDGSIRLNGLQIRKPDTEIDLGDCIELLTHAQRRPLKPPFDILFEDEAILVTHKPAGLVVESFHRKICQITPVILTHRLDQKVSGVMIFAKSQSIEKQLESEWTQFEKIYIALVEGKPEKSEGRIENYLAENKALKVYATQDSQAGKKAITHYKTLEQNRFQARLEIRLETGRKNQIRVHMADMGCPIAGDIKYGARTQIRGRIALHAHRLSFYHPVTHEWMSFSCEVPF